MAKHQPKWSAGPTKDDFAAAESYLNLLFRDTQVRKIIAKARTRKPSQHVAKDLLRACDLPLLPVDERHVAEDLKRIHKNKALSPIILVQGDLRKGRPFVIADGYHRLCAT